MLSEPLAGTLGYINAVKHEVGIVLAPEVGGTVATAVCGQEISFTGTVLLRVTGTTGAASTESGLSMNGSSSGQEVESLEGGEPSVLVFNFGSPFALATLTVSFSNSGEAVELKA
jgi:hypothetical protein